MSAFTTPRYGRGGYSSEPFHDSDSFLPNYARTSIRTEIFALCRNTSRCASNPSETTPPESIRPHRGAGR